MSFARPLTPYPPVSQPLKPLSTDRARSYNRLGRQDRDKPILRCARPQATGYLPNAVAFGSHYSQEFSPRRCTAWKLRDAASEVTAAGKSVEYPAPTGCSFLGLGSFGKNIVGNS